MTDETTVRVEGLHHVSLPVSDLERSRRFYRDVLRLTEIERPPFSFPGAWFAVGDRQLHLIVHDRPTFRDGRAVDSRDVHFAVRVADIREALAHLRAEGYTTDAADERMRTYENLRGAAGFPQVFVMDPDRHVIEINAGRLD